MKVLISERQNIFLNKIYFNSLIEKVIKEDIQVDPNWGCENFRVNSDARQWCKNAETNIRKKLKIINQKLDYVKEVMMWEENKDISQNLKAYDKEDQFFILRMAQLDEVKNILKNSCSNIETKIGEFINDIQKKYIFIKRINDKYEYDLLNKLNSNYSALSFLLTHFREKNSLQYMNFNDIFNYYFEVPEASSRVESYFTMFLLNYFYKKGDVSDIMKVVYKTIEETSKIGAQSEREAYEFLSRKFGGNNIKNYTGDYSFVDLFGIDFLVKGIFGEDYIPVQVKTKVSKLYGNSKLCKNIAMGKNDVGEWVVRLYDGTSEISSI